MLVSSTPITWEEMPIEQRIKMLENNIKNLKSELEREKNELEKLLAKKEAGETIYYVGKEF